MNRSVSISLVAVLTCAACQGTAPSDLESRTGEPALRVAGNSGCYVVEGTISETGEFPTFVGRISGDLEGTSTTTLSFEIGVSGAVIHVPGERTLEITGGTVGDLIGSRLHETFDGLTIAEADPLIRINERTRVDEGARLGNLTSEGTLDQRPSPWQVEMRYRGVICP